MIIRNESKIIERVINSTIGVIDAICICDTGSSFEEFQKTRTILEKYDPINIYIYKHAWKNFGYNRTKSFNACRKCAEEEGYELKDTYALLLDADMELIVNDGFNKSNLMNLCYNLLQGNQGLEYYNTRLIRLDNEWKCYGVTHEYWSCEKCPYQCKKERQQSLWIKDHGDGGCKQNKFERDISLLKQGLQDEPENTRYIFYLAQSYRDIGDKLKAIEFYKKHAASNAWDEERWYSMMQIGLCADNFNDKTSWLVKAHEFRPGRAEPLYHLAVLFRMNNMWYDSFRYAWLGLMVPYPINDVLFIETSIYNYRLLYEISISAYYVPEWRMYGKWACEKLLNMHLPDDVLQDVRRNIHFYIE